ncbi:carbon storage regulator [Planctellipticum variicoloris]|jgi:carbon storage regulator|uniref:carbon storage regulator n=1 Tax=Planctellipticum variicoloris TaxID=3064265 RepID=UPI00301349A5|nr:carbon storage regulator [Planctomycetaceae bacterium SH412]
MLVLTRKSGEELVIGDGIVVSVLSVQGGRVQIGIAAPKSVRIRRLEAEPKLPEQKSDSEIYVCASSGQAE